MHVQCVLTFLWCSSLDCHDGHTWWMVIVKMWIDICYIWIMICYIWNVNCSLLHVIYVIWHYTATIYVTGYWKTDHNVTLGQLHFIGPANSHTHALSMHCCITGLSWLVCFSRAGFADRVKSRLRQWDPWRALDGRCSWVWYSPLCWWDIS